MVRRVRNKAQKTQVLIGLFFNESIQRRHFGYATRHKKTGSTE
jgi:hypothetical protein